MRPTYRTSFAPESDRRNHTMSLAPRPDQLRIDFLELPVHVVRRKSRLSAERKRPRAKFFPEIGVAGKLQYRRRQRIDILDGTKASDIG